MEEKKTHLPRLAEGFYNGRSFIHWTHTIEKRATGWSTPEFHSAFRETLIHSAGRYEIAVPAYCLMPDHLHLLAIGLRDSTSHRNSSKQVRREINRLIGPRLALQRQAHDHVLSEAEREKGAFEATAYYIRNNPVRAGLISADSTETYPFVGGIFPGYPELDFRAPDYWDRFWKIYAYDQRQTAKEP